jgi:WD40 repeat protein
MGSLFVRDRFWALSMRNYRIIGMAFAAVFLLAACIGDDSGRELDGRAMAVSVSADGRYALSAHGNNNIVLWNLEEQSSRVISENGNIYSASFSINSSVFVWQDQEGSVVVQEVDGEAFNAWDMPDAYSISLSSSPDRVVLTDIGWGVHVATEEGIVSPKKSDGQAALGFGKSLNVELDGSGERFLTAGFGGPRDQQLDLEDQGNGYPNLNGVALWGSQNGDAVHVLSGNSAKTHATFSPDGNYVVSVDENGKGFVWDAHTGSKEQRLSRLGVGVYVGGHPTGSPKNRDTSGLRLERNSPDFPDDFSNFGYVAVQFITDEHYLAFFYNQRYAALHKLGDPFALKMVDLGHRPFPFDGSLRPQCLNSFGP